MKTTRTFDDITQILTHRKSANTAASAANVKKADTPSCVPEKDPSEKGTVTVPCDPDADLAKSTLPSAKPTNTDETPSLTPPAVEKTVNGQEPCSINMKIAGIVSKIRDLNTKQAVAEKTVSESKTSIPGGQAEIKSIPAKPTEKGAPKDPPTGPIDEAGSKAAGAPGTAKDQVKGDKDPNDKGEVKVKSDAIDGLPKGEDVENTDKQAAEDLMQITPDFHIKLAQVILSTEEGRQVAEDLLLQSLGQEAAQDLIKAAAIMENQANQMAAYEASGEAYADQLWQSATPQERDQILKLAAIHEYQKTRFIDPEIAEFQKAAYDAGSEAAAGQMDGDASAATGGSPDAAPDAAPAGGDAAPGGGDVSEDDIVQVLQQLVQSGELTPEVAEQLLVQLFGGGDAAGAGGDASAAPGGSSADEGAAPAEIAEPAEKAASILHELLKKEAAANAPIIPSVQKA